MAKKKRTIDEKSKQAYNYAVLSRHDPKVAQIFFSSAICNAYKFNIEEGEWDKLDCQGTLFIYSRVARDANDVGDAYKFPYGLTILNRLSLENFTLGISPLCIAQVSGEPEMAVSMEDPFIMVQSADGGMYGLWLFHERDREPVLQTIQWCLDQDTRNQPRPQSDQANAHTIQAQA